MPVSLNVLAQRQARYDRRVAEAQKVVPHGDYCYSRTGEQSPVPGMRRKIVSCPYFKGMGSGPARSYAYCRLLKRGDHTQGRAQDGESRGTSALWDMLKCCGINTEVPEEQAA